MKKDKHYVRTYNLSGHMMYEAEFVNADLAYKEYLEIINNMKRTLPEGYGVNVIRFKNEYVMCMQTVIGEN